MEKHFKQLATLIGDPTRATILWTLLDGRAFTATELAMAADTSPQNISMHLAKLVQADLLCAETQGRHRYYKFSRKDVAYAIEAMANLVPRADSKSLPVIAGDPSIKYCRTCYDHLAGKAGVALTEQLLKQKIICIDERQYDVTAKGMKWFEVWGIDVVALRSERRAFARQCLDWSERRHHLGGALGAAVLDKLLTQGWVRSVKNSRAVIITAKGQAKFYETLRLSL